jgi:CDP-diacylglycerol--glycerol-3-phosphate 3-phosphatidyltransferase
MNWPLANLLLWIAVILTLYSGMDYIFGFLKNHND